MWSWECRMCDSLINKTTFKDFIISLVMFKYSKLPCVVYQGRKHKSKWGHLWHWSKTWTHTWHYQLWPSFSSLFFLLPASLARCWHLSALSLNLVSSNFPFSEHSANSRTGSVWIIMMFFSCFDLPSDCLIIGHSFSSLECFDRLCSCFLNSHHAASPRINYLNIHRQGLWLS